MVFQPGDNIHRNLKAADMNGLLEMLRWFRLEGRKIGGPGHRQKNFDGEIYVKNTTSSDVAAFGVLGLGDPSIDPTVEATRHERFNRITVDGTTPSTSTPHYGKFAVLQEPAKKDGGIARALVWGPTYATLNIGDTDDVAADITNNSTSELTTSIHGSARILWKQSGTGSGKLGIVRLGDWVAHFIGKANSPGITAGSSGTVSAWHGTPGSETDTGIDVSSCYNRTGLDIDTDTWCKVTSINGRLYVEPWECP